MHKLFLRSHESIIALWLRSTRYLPLRWQLHPEVMVALRYPLEQACEAYKLFDSGKTGKMAIVWK